MNQQRRLRVAVVHSFYASENPSGENQVVREQLAALRRAGHDPVLLPQYTDELSRHPLYSLRAAATVATGHGRSQLAELRRLLPDVVHVHNLFPNFGRKWLLRWPGPIVTTVHNYRPLCAAATLYREGSACTLCPDGDRWAGLRNGCYRQSRMATSALAWAGRRGAAADPLLRRSDRVMVLSDTSRSIYTRAGVPQKRIDLVPNFTTDFTPSPQVAGPSTGRPARWIFAGRLTPEKGLLELLQRWPADCPLDVAGSGPLLDDCRRIAPDGVRFLGTLDREELRRRLPTWTALVFPSRCLEGAPVIYLEALAAGLPVLAFPGSTVADAVRAQGTGAVVHWDQPLGPVLRDAAERFPALRPHCRKVFEQRYTEEAWTTRVQEVYAAAMSSRANGNTP